ncbi:MAG: hypothetical protein JWR26_1863 [Pedosphaera sp.]|nr:hypothetical protein [Pedosphaera sp.]
MTPWMQKSLESKRAARKELTALPFAQKLEILEKLRDRSLLIASSPLHQRKPSRPKAR